MLSIINWLFLLFCIQGPSIFEMIIIMPTRLSDWYFHSRWQWKIILLSAFEWRFEIDRKRQYSLYAFRFVIHSFKRCWLKNIMLKKLSVYRVFLLIFSYFLVITSLLEVTFKTQLCIHRNYFRFRMFAEVFIQIFTKLKMSC